MAGTVLAQLIARSHEQGFEDFVEAAFGRRHDNGVQFIFKENEAYEEATGFFID